VLAAYLALSRRRPSLSAFGACAASLSAFGACAAGWTQRLRRLRRRLDGLTRTKEPQEDEAAAAAN